MSKGFFYKGKYPTTTKCATLDAQISGIKNDLDKVTRNLMYGNKYDVKRFLIEKERLFNAGNCSEKLSDKEVYGSFDILNTQLKKTEERILGKANKKRKAILIGGSVVLVLGLIILIK